MTLTNESNINPKRRIPGNSDKAQLCIVRLQIFVIAEAFATDPF